MITLGIMAEFGTIAFIVFIVLFIVMVGHIYLYLKLLEWSKERYSKKKPF